MAEAPLTPQRILAAAEDVLRRYGPAKATVVDVAQALGVSHGSVYRHFATKAALRDAVLRDWLQRAVAAPLAAVVASRAAPPKRLRNWLAALRDAKRSKALDDPELFATYGTLAADAREVIHDHVEAMLAQLQHILADGMASGDFRSGDARTVARMLFDATARFHHPAMAYLWRGKDEDAAFKAVLDTLLRGLRK
ncbi:MAG TPA: TetR family transcriptional regulator [Rhodanobacteraceae bacterium]|nr:TetR family transcriptional regulator [Rhodanobacteraceae bacterium]